MSRVRFFALGGLGEVGKNMYVVEVDDKIFVLDAGSASPVSQVFGYDQIIPDYTYLLDNIEKVQGVFITHFHQNSSGAFARIVKDLKVPYYGSEFTMDAIKERYIPSIPEEDMEGIVLNRVKPGSTIDFNGIKIEFFSLTNSVPDTLGIAIKINVNPDGEKPLYKNILYMPDFNFDQNVKGHFRTDFKSLAEISDEGVIALLSSSTGAAKIGHITTDEKLNLALHKIMSHEGRTFALMFSDNVAGIIQVIKAACEQKRHVTIIGSKARILVELAMNLDYVNFCSEYYMTKSALNDEKRNSPNTVIIIAGEQTEPFFAMQRIATFQDKHYFLTNKDNVVIIPEIPKKYEKVLANTWDNIWLDNANVIDFDSNLMPDSIAGAEDLKLLYSLLSPEYIIPISGDYRMLKAQVNLAKEYGFDSNHIVELDNGLIATIENEKLVPELSGIETGDILFGVDSDSDINDYVAREREALTQEGFIIVSGMINLKEREIYGDIEIVSSGFLPEFGQEQEFELIKEEFKKIVNYHLRMKKVDYKDLRLDLKNALSKKILRETKKRPILIPVIIDISV